MDTRENILEKKTSAKDLGVIMTSKLNYTNHINNIVNSSFKILGLIKRNSIDVCATQNLNRTVLGSEILHSQILL